MNIKQTILKISGAFLVFGALLSPLAIAPGVSAQTCGGVPTSIIECPDDNPEEGVEGTAIWSVLEIILGIMTGLVAVAALGGIVWGAVLYTSAGGSSEQIKKAMTIFTNVVIGVIAYAAMYTLSNFLIPGGIFG